MTSPDESAILVEGPWTHRTIRANGIALHVAELGTGPLVLLLHGFPTFWWTWHRQLVDLAEAAHMLADCASPVSAFISPPEKTASMPLP